MGKQQDGPKTEEVHTCNYSDTVSRFYSFVKGRENGIWRFLNWALRPLSLPRVSYAVDLKWRFWDF